MGEKTISTPLVSLGSDIWSRNSWVIPLRAPIPPLIQPCLSTLWYKVTNDPSSVQGPDTLQWIKLQKFPFC